MTKLFSQPIFKISVFIVFSLSMFATHADDSLARGKELSAVCASCHGPNGTKSVTPDIPLLGSQHRSYLVQALKSYRSGARQNLIMKSFVQNLSDQNIEDLATWYSQQQGSLHTPDAHRQYP